MKLASAVIAGLVVGLQAQEDSKTKTFDPKKDLLSLHYDHAPDQDDGHSAAADRTMLQLLYGREWLNQHVVAVSGAYGTNAKTFNDKSDAVMDACWGDAGGWLDAHEDQKTAVTKLVARWADALGKGGEVWVKEGGQSDITLMVINALVEKQPALDVKHRVHVVQHSNWNENKTTPEALKQVKRLTDYIRIKDANAYLNQKKGNAAFEKSALKHPQFGLMWKAAFDYYAPSKRLDFSDTGELMHILGLGEFGIDDFRKRFLDPVKERATP